MTRIRYNTAEIIHTMEVELDSLRGIIKDRRVNKKICRLLGLVRRLQRTFPQECYTLGRCFDPREPPSLKRKGIPRELHLRNWRAFKRKQALKKVKPLDELFSEGR